MRRRLPIALPTAGVVRRAYATIDAQIAEVVDNARKAGHRIPCNRGCAGCCSRPAAMAHTELPALVEAIRALPAHVVRAIEAGLHAWRRRATAAGIELATVRSATPGYLNARLVCPLLDTETQLCRVYGARPLSCRGHFIADEGDGGARCADEVGPPTLMMTGVVAAGLLRLDVLPSRGELSVVLLLPEMLLRAWAMVRGRQTFAEFSQEILAWRRAQGETLHVTDEDVAVPPELEAQLKRALRRMGTR
jgi:Fe-S-cluster containining protein